MKKFQYDTLPACNPRQIVQSQVNSSFEKYQHVLQQKNEIIDSLKGLLQTQQDNSNFFNSQSNPDLQEFQDFVNRTKFQMIKQCVKERIATPKIKENYEQNIKILEENYKALINNTKSDINAYKRENSDDNISNFINAKRKAFQDIIDNA